MDIRKATTQYEFFSLMQIRAAVFMCEQNVDPLLEIDDEDRLCDHYILEDNNEMIATCRVLHCENEWHLGRIAVIKKYRHNNYGKALLQYVIQLAKDRQVQSITLGAQLHALPFYETIGFRAYGDVYEEANIQHRNMEMSL